MPSSITLTVSHLPQSTSFFLAALQPLHYHYVGRSDNTIGFGPEGGRADFWITQEVPGVPAGAAHVAFNAASRKEVEYFFTTALKAGGKIHDGPAVRDSEGYYSAAVIDFDGNSIEAVYRPSSVERVGASVVSSNRSRPQLASEVSGATARTSDTRQKGHGDLFDGLMAEARNAVGTARDAIDTCRSRVLGQPHDGQSDGIVGTLVGVAAGAALTYFVTRQDKDAAITRRRPSVSERSYTEPPRHEYRAIEDRRSSFSDSKSRPRSYYSTSPKSHVLEEIEYLPAPPSSRGNRSRRHSDVSSVSRSKASRAIKMIEGPPPPVAVTELSSKSNRSGSHHSSNRESVLTVRQLNRTSTYPPPAPSSKYSKHSPPSKSSSRRDPKDYPLPASRVGTTYSSTSRREPKDYPLPLSRASTFNGLDAAPTEPVSHIGSSRRGSKVRSSHSKMDVPVTPDDSISQVSSVTSDRTIRASDRRSTR